MDSWKHSEWHVVRLAHLNPTHIGEAACHSGEGGYVPELPHFSLKNPLTLPSRQKAFMQMKIYTSVRSKPVSKESCKREKCTPYGVYPLFASSQIPGVYFQEVIYFGYLILDQIHRILYRKYCWKHLLERGYLADREGDANTSHLIENRLWQCEMV
jgi:hypothetical protein